MYDVMLFFRILQLQFVEVLHMYMYMYIHIYNVYSMTFAPHPQTTHRGGGEGSKKRESEETMTAASYEVRGHRYQLLVVINEWLEQ